MNFSSRRIFSEKNVGLFKQLLSRESWAGVYEAEGNLKFNSFYNTFCTHFNSAFPYIIVKNTRCKDRRKPWISNDIILEGRQLRDLHKSSINDTASLIEYKKLKQQHKLNIEKAKIMYNDSIINTATNKSKASWQIINKHRNCRGNNTDLPETLINNDGKTIIGAPNIANEFNIYFCDSVHNITNRIKVDPVSNLGVPFHEKSMFLKPVTTEEVYAKLSLLSKKGSAGYDEIPCSLPIKVAEYLIEPLTYLLNDSFENGYFPDELKKSLIVPLHKKLEKNQIANYRPIALLSIFSKLYESIFNDRLVDFVEENKIIASNQFGFQKNKSTEEAVFKFYNKVLQELEEKHLTLGIFFHFSKAFDCINHKLLCSKLYNDGIRGNALDWLASYLCNRSQFVKVSNSNSTSYSREIKMDVGVPQGSTLGPILFILFINDLAKTLAYDFTLFADDTSTDVSAVGMSELGAKAEQCIGNVTSWCVSNGLSLNKDKTVLVHFSNIHNKPNSSVLVKVNSKSIPLSEDTRFLGIYIDKFLSWDKHIDELAKSLSKSCFCARRLRTSVSLNSMLMYYHSCFGSLLNYGILCWGHGNQTDRVFRYQKRILRTIFNLSSRSSCREFFKRYKLLTVPSIYILHSLCYVKRHPDQFMRWGDVSNYCTRNRNKLLMPSFNTTLTEKGPFVTAVRLYNRLPPSIQGLNHYSQFKNSLKQFLIQGAYYSIEEFA